MTFQKTRPARAAFLLLLIPALVPFLLARAAIFGAVMLRGKRPRPTRECASATPTPRARLHHPASAQVESHPARAELIGAVPTFTPVVAAGGAHLPTPLPTFSPKSNAAHHPSDARRMLVVILRRSGPTI